MRGGSGLTGVSRTSITAREVLLGVVVVDLVSPPNPPSSIAESSMKIEIFLGMQYS